MQEREHYHLAIITAETMYNLWELENQQGELDLDEMMRRLKDLSAYSLTHAEIMVLREGVQLLAPALFFGITSESRFQKNRERLNLLYEETFGHRFIRLGNVIIPSMNREIEEYFVQKVQQQIQPEDVLTEQEYQLLQQVQAGEIPCPWCERPFIGSFYFFLDDGYQYKGVRLQCSGCGFDER